MMIPIQPTDETSDSSRAARATWRTRYPVLLACLTQGRNPTRADLQQLASRIGREAGDGTIACPSDGQPLDDVCNHALKAARLALEGDGSQPRRYLASPPPLGGH